MTFLATLGFKPRRFIQFRGVVFRHVWPDVRIGPPTVGYRIIKPVKPPMMTSSNYWGGNNVNRKGFSKTGAGDGGGEDERGVEGAKAGCSPGSPSPAQVNQP